MDENKLNQTVFNYLRNFNKKYIEDDKILLINYIRIVN